ncbi:hypothetical protein [Rugamonas sp.]|uniref:hypothetical protein n=1 Tax=Rugamonas sp. TaxID=1926287 RepID=UPI0025FEAF6B|nr:hypothetical protein [Rugamonas sp.]
MTRWHTLRRRLLAPVVYLAALFLMLEDWLWNLGARLTAGLAHWAPLRRLERRIARLRPVPALVLFLLPPLLLFPVKLVALYAMSSGHPWSGLAVVIVAKLVSAAAVARLYILTRPALMTMPWFARLEARFLALKERAITSLQATAAWRQARAMSAALRRGRRHAAPHWQRLLRRLAALWRARRH